MSLNLDVPNSPRLATVLVDGITHDVALSPVGNKIYWAFRPDLTGSGAGFATLQLSLLPGTNFIDGDSITINNRTILARATPTARQLQAGASGASNTERLFQIVSTDPVLKVNYQASFEFDGFGIGYVRLVAKKAGTLYDLTYSANTVFAPVIAFNTAGLNGDDNQGRAGWSAYVQVYVDPRLSTRREFARSRAIPPANMQFVQELRATYAEYRPSSLAQPVAVTVDSLLKPFLESTPPSLNFNAVQGITQMPIAMIRYAVIWGESYVEPGQVFPTRVERGRIGFDETESFWAVNSALVGEALPINIHSRFESFWERSDLADRINYLTRHPNAKRTWLDGYEFLYWIHYSQGAKGVRPKLTLKYNFYYEDGTELLNQYAAQPTFIIGAGNGTVYYCEVGYRQLRRCFPDVEDGPALHSFGVVIHEFYNDPGGAFSRDITIEQRYEIQGCDRCDLYAKPQLIFENPQGGFDTLRCTGDYEKETAATATAYGFEPFWITHFEANNGLPIPDQLPSSLGSDAQPELISPSGLGERANIRSTTTQTYTLRTGYLTQTEAEWLQNSLLTSPQTYLIAFDDPDGAGNANYPIPRKCYVESNTVKIARFDDLIQFEFKVVASMPQNSLTV